MISEFPLFVFTTLAGMSAGAYAVNAVFPANVEAKRPWLFPLTCLALLGLGLLGCLGHLARPLLFLNALANPSAGITQEAYLSIAFGVLLLAELILSWRKGSSPRALSIAAGVAGLALATVMGFAYVSNHGVPAWTTWATVPLFVVGDLAMGAALCAVFKRELYQRVPFVAAAIALDVLSIAVIMAVSAHFGSVGEETTLFVAGAVVMILAAVGGAVAKAGKISANAVAWVVLACAVVGIALARYGFYAACAV